jgi:hypothetical protein
LTTTNGMFDLCRMVLQQRDPTSLHHPSGLLRLPDRLRECANEAR